MHPIIEGASGSAHTPIHRDRNLRSVLAGIVGILTLWAVALSSASNTGEVGRYVNAYGILLVLLSPMAVLTPIYGWAGVVDAFAWIARKPGGGRGARDAVTFFQLAAAFALAFGFINAMIGMVIASLGPAECRRSWGRSLRWRFSVNSTASSSR